MPPKVYRRVPRQQRQSRPNEQADSSESLDKMLPTDRWDINMAHVLQNVHVMERIHTLTSILAAVMAGLLNVNLYGGIIIYLGLHLVMMGLTSMKLKDLNKYFLKSSDVAMGLGSGVLVFLCVWIIVYNVVYTL